MADPLSSEKQQPETQAEPQAPMYFGLDAYSPDQIAERVENVGIKKARLPFLSAFTLAILAGGFIGMGGIAFTFITSDPSLSFGVARFLGGLGFSLGYILVLVAGAEIFTANNLLVMAWAARKISSMELLRDWAIVLGGNAVGALGLAVIVVLSGHPQMYDGAVARQAVDIAADKVSLPFWEAFFRGVLANLFICLASWVAMAGRSVTDKVLATIFPISAFVAVGFEQSVANLYFIPLGILVHNAGTAVDPGVPLHVGGFIQNMVPVTLGNIIGGSVMVALVYYIVYRSKASVHWANRTPPGPEEREPRVRRGPGQ